MTLPTVLREAMFTVAFHQSGQAIECEVKACYFVTEDRMVIFKGLRHEQVFAVNIDAFIAVNVTELPEVKLDRVEVSEADEARWRETYGRNTDPTVPHLHHDGTVKSGGANVLFS